MPNFFLWKKDEKAMNTSRVPAAAMHTSSAAASHAGDAVLLEPRALGHIPELLLNARQELPPSFVIHFLHGPDNHLAARRLPALRPAFRAGLLRLRPLEGELPDGTDFTSRKWYNRHLMTRAFWSGFAAPLLLLFEADSAFCHAPLRSPTDYMGFAYVGAPWAPSLATGRNPSWCKNLPSCVGNAGLSLWRRDVMANITRRTPEAYFSLVNSYLKHSRGARASLGSGRERGEFDGGKNAKQPQHVDTWFSRVLHALEAAGGLPRGVRATPSEQEVRPSRAPRPTP